MATALQGQAKAQSSATATYTLTGDVNRSAQGGGVSAGQASYQTGVPPLAPTLLAPISNTSADLSTAPFQWTFTSPVGKTQASYALRFKALGAANWSWYYALANLLTAVDASFETGIGSWSGTNATLAQSNAEALDGSYSLALTAVTAANMSAQTGSALYAVTAGLTYTGMAWVRAAATARTCTVGINWYSTSGALISTSASPGVADATTDWTLEITAPAVAPTGAVFAQLVVTVESPAAAEAHYVDECAVIETSSPNLVYDSNLSLAIAATNPTWTSPGTIGTANGDYNVLNAGTDQAEWVYYGTGAAATLVEWVAQFVPVTAGALYTFSAFIDASSVTNSASLYIAVREGSSAGGTILGTAAQSVGAASVVSVTVTVPSGISTVTVCLNNGATVTAGAQLTYSQIQLTETSSVQPYQPGPVWSPGGSPSLSATEVYNASAAQTVTPGIPPLSNGNTYTWQVSVGDTSGIVSAYSQSSFVTGAPTPVVTPTGPTGTIPQGSATLVWSTSNILNMASWQVILYTLAQTQAAGFAPGSSPWIWNSGVTLGSASSVVLPNVAVGSYVAYIQVTSTLGPQSAWTPWDLTYSYTAPAQPTLTATYNTSNQTVSLTLGLAAGFPASSYGSVYRSLDGGSTWTVVSTFDLVPLTSGGTSQAGTDYTPNASQTEGAFSNIEYYGVIVGPGGIVSPRSATQTVTPSFPAPVGQAPPPGWNFLDATDYSTTYQPIITKMTQEQTIRGGLHPVQGTAYPVYTYDVVVSRVLKLTAWTIAVDDWISLRAMLQSEHVFYLTNVYGLVGFFQIDPKGYSEDQQIGSKAATIRETTFTLVETFTLPSEGAGT